MTIDLRSYKLDYLILCLGI